jgi:GH43 family beta-xylosidase
MIILFPFHKPLPLRKMKTCFYRYGQKASPQNEVYPGLLLVKRQVTLWVMLLLAITARSQTFKNPMRYGAADPWMIYHNGYYYMTYTGGAWIDIVKAKSVNDIISSPPVTVYNNSSNYDYPWAPEIHRLNGPNGWRFYIYFTSAPTGQARRMYVLESAADDPMGPYTLKGRIYDPNHDEYAIDGHVFRHSNGTLYYLWSGGPSTSDHVYIATMSNPWTLGSGRVELAVATQSFECGGGLCIAEGPEVIERNGKIFLTYSVSACWSPQYALRMLSANSSSNLLSKSSWTSTPGTVFSSNAANEAYGPGHNGFFKSPNGAEDWLIYHAVTNPAGDCGGGRSIRIKRLNWNGDGTPDFGSPDALNANLTLPAGDPGGGTFNNMVFELEPQNAPGMRLDVTGAVDADGTNALLYHQNGNSAQDWKFVDVGGGYYELIPQCAPSRRLDVAGTGTTDGTNVYIWHRWSDNNPAQQWKLIDAGGGYYEFEPKCAPGMRLDVAGSGTTDNTEVYIWHRWSDNNPAQRWKLIYQTSAGRTAGEPTTPQAEPSPLRAYPNPSGGKVHVAYTPRRSGPLSLELHDGQGRRVQPAFEGVGKAGQPWQHTIAGEMLRPGVYFLRLRTPSGTYHQKLFMQ